ncbi:hypothetical protein PG997_013307 [Apiospora hydei]|uniref:Uncharacterized protein n=1 Tax=Apiospora hydei TaxID=1337664 RepID=A0ABR1V8G5_9PEZI
MSSRLFLASSGRGANAIRTTVEAPMLLGFGPSSLSSGTTTPGAGAGAAAFVGRTPLLKLARRSLHTPCPLPAEAAAATRRPAPWHHTGHHTSSDQ